MSESLASLHREGPLEPDGKASGSCRLLLQPEGASAEKSCVGLPAPLGASPGQVTSWHSRMAWLPLPSSHSSAGLPLLSWAGAGFLSLPLHVSRRSKSSEHMCMSTAPVPCPASPLSPPPGSLAQVLPQACPHPRLQGSSRQPLSFNAVHVPGLPLPPCPVLMGRGHLVPQQCLGASHAGLINE